MDKLEKDIKLLKLLNKKIVDDSEFSIEDQELLMDLVGEFKDKSPDEINGYFKDKLNNDEKKVFINFYSNVKNIGSILDSWKHKKEPSRDEIRNYFFKGKNVSKLLFTDEFRGVLDYIQNNLNVKVKAEVYADLKVYFETGSYDEDLLKDPIFAENVIKCSNDSEKLFEYISKKSQERNIPVEVISDKESGHHKIAIRSEYLNKIGIAKNGFVDCVKVVPKGIVISLATSDGTLTFNKEKRQLVDHLAAIFHSINSGQFYYYEKVNNKYIMRQVKSVDEIKEVRFNMLTSSKSENESNKSIELESLNMFKERLVFLSECMTQVIDSPALCDNLKRIISLEGIACEGINSSSVANLEEFNKSELKGLIDKKDEILSVYTRQKELVEDYLNSVCKYLLATTAIDIKDVTGYCERVNDFISSFRSILSGSHSQLIPYIYNKDTFSKLNLDAKDDIAKKQISELEKQSKLSMFIKDETNSINEDLSMLCPDMTAESIMSKAISQLNSNLKGDKMKVKFTPENKIFIANNPSLELRLRLEAGYINEPMSALKRRCGDKGDKVTELIDRVINKENIIFDIEKSVKPKY